MSTELMQILWIALAYLAARIVNSYVSVTSLL